MLIVGLFCSPYHLLEDSFSVVWQVRVQSFEVLSSRVSGRGSSPCCNPERLSIVALLWSKEAIAESQRNHAALKEFEV